MPWQIISFAYKCRSDMCRQTAPLSNVMEQPACPHEQTVCQLNGELIVFGGSDEPTETHDAQHVSKEVDAFVFHVRPRLRRKVLAPSQGFGGGGIGGINSVAPSQPLPSETPMVHDGPALSQWHERAMAKEVVAHMALVEAAEDRRVEAARAAAGNTGPLEVTATALDEIRGTSAPDKRSRGREHLQGPEVMLSAGAGINAVWDAIPLAQPERGSASSQWITLNKSPVRPYGVEVRVCCQCVSFWALVCSFVCLETQ